MIVDQKTMAEMADAFEKVFQEFGAIWFVDEAIAQSNPLLEGDDYYKLAKIVASETRTRLKWKLSRCKFVGISLGEGKLKKLLILPRGHPLFQMAWKMGMFNKDSLRAINVNTDGQVFLEKKEEKKKPEGLKKTEK